MPMVAFGIKYGIRSKSLTEGTASVVFFGAFCYHVFFLGIPSHNCFSFEYFQYSSFTQNLLWTRRHQQKQPASIPCLIPLRISSLEY